MAQLTTPSTETITETFNLIVQKGIEGGFAPPTPTERYLITRAPRSSIFIISRHDRDRGTPDLELIVERNLRVSDYAKSIIRLQEILAQIPTQHVGAQDIYGRNTSIVQVTDATKLQDLRKSGVKAGEGIPYPTEEQKVLFDEAVTIVEKWGAPKGPSQ